MPFFKLIPFICRTGRILTQMPSSIKSMCLACLASALIGQSGWEAQAQTAGGQSATRKSSASSGAAPSTSSRTNPTSKTGTTTKTTPRTGTTGTKVATAPPGRAPLDDRRPPLPVAKPTRIPTLSPAMEAILEEWEAKSSKIQRLEGSFEHRSYDSTFGIEQVTEGRYCFQYPDKGSFHQVGRKVKEGEKGWVYPNLKSGAAERWICTGESIYKILEKEKQYEVVPIPPEDRGQNIRNSPLPFLFGMKADEAKQRYKFELVEAKTNDKVIVLKVYPQMKHDLHTYKKADVQLDRATCLPLAVKLYDTTDQKLDLYIFSKADMSINKTGGWSKWFVGDPLKPNLGAYKKVVSHEDQSEAPAGTKLAPNPVDRRSTSTPGTRNKTLGPQTAPQRTAQRLDEDDEPPARASTKGTARP